VCTCDQPVVSLAAVVSQLDLALRESQVPVAELGEAIARISAGLAARQEDGPLRNEVARCLEALQFYDRLTQHVSHLLDFVSGMTATMDAAMRGTEDEAAWGELRARLRSRLISDQQRELLDLLLPPDPGQQQSRRQAGEAHAVQGSIELF
jgi:hypothetical protein